MINVTNLYECILQSSVNDITEHSQSITVSNIWGAAIYYLAVVFVYGLVLLFGLKVVHTILSLFRTIGKSKVVS